MAWDNQLLLPKWFCMAVVQEAKLVDGDSWVIPKKA
jgi:hypothetical protein